MIGKPPWNRGPGRSKFRRRDSRAKLAGPKPINPGDWTWLSIPDDQTWNTDTGTWEEQSDAGAINRGPAVFSDLVIFNAPMTQDKFVQELSFGGPAGFEDWRQFIAGNYQFQRAALRYIVQSTTADRPRITAMIFAVDVPDINDRGTATIAAGPGYTFVPFNRVFTSTNSLEIAAILKGGTVNASIQREDPGGLTTSGFNVRLQAPDGSFPAGTISWTASGF